MRKLRCLSMYISILSIHLKHRAKVSDAESRDRIVSGSGARRGVMGYIDYNYNYYIIDLLIEYRLVDHDASSSSPPKALSLSFYQSNDSTRIHYMCCVVLSESRSRSRSG